MISLLAVIAVFVVTIVNTVHKDKVKEGQKTIWGLSQTAVLIIGLVVVAMGLTIYNEISIQREAKIRTAREQKLSQNLDALITRLNVVQTSVNTAAAAQTDNPAARQQALELQNQLQTIRQQAERLDADDDDN